MSEDSKGPTTAKLTVGDREIILPVIYDTFGNCAVDVTGILGMHKLLIHDKAVSSTSTSTSQITYIDADKGILLYRGYPIEQLAEKCSYLETAYLLLNGKLPNQAQLQSFEQEISNRISVPADMAKILAGYERSTHPMELIGALVSHLHDHYPVNHKDDAGRYEAALNQIAKMPTLVAMA